MRRWLNGAILLGFATGPPLYGLAIDARFETGFVALSSLAICLPVAWQRFRVVDTLGRKH